MRGGGRVSSCRAGSEMGEVGRPMWEEWRVYMHLETPHPRSGISARGVSRLDGSNQTFRTPGSVTPPWLESSDQTRQVFLALIMLAPIGWDRM